LDGSTTFKINEYLNVDANRVVTINGLNKDAYCNDEDPEILTTDVKGGVFNSEIIANEFRPRSAKEGMNYITYTHTMIFTENFGKDTVKECFSIGRDSAIVYIIQPISFSIINPKKEYCKNDSSILLTTDPKGGTFNGYVYPSEHKDTLKIDPASLILGNNTITYTYIDTNNCSNIFTDNIQINNIPVINIIDLSSQYCLESGNDTIKGTVENSIVDAGKFWGEGIIDIDTTDGIAIFNPDSASNIGTYSIKYQYTDTTTGCSNTVNKNVTINKADPIKLLGYENKYCQSNETKKLIGTPPNGIYTIDEVSGETWNNFPLNEAGTHFVAYTYKNPQGCENSVSDTIKVSPKANIHFSINDECIVDSIIFKNRSTIDGDSYITNWTWDFDDNGSSNDTSILENPSYKYSTSGIKKISIKAITNSGCEYVKDSSISLGNGPSADFAFKNECIGTDTVLFTDQSTGSGIYSRIWSFGDGVSKLDSTTISSKHKYAEIGNYTAQLIIVTENGCNDTISKQVSIRPYINNYPYIEDFENGQGSWVARAIDKNNSWALGTPASENFIGAASGENAWCTNLEGNFNTSEQSWVDGPCFDFTDIKRPMIKLNYKSSTDEGFDGAVLQASVNGGSTWQNVGELEDGINWFNRASIVATPGFQKNVTPGLSGWCGWSGEYSDKWYEARHELDDYAGKSKVLFRVAFGSDASSNREGFTFDDIWIGERKRNVLVEQFTNSFSEECAKDMPSFNNYIAANNSDFIDIQYHTNFAGDDEMYSQNPFTPSARALYYGVTNEPYTLMDGNQYRGNTKQWVKDSTYQILRALEDPKFEIELTTSLNSESIDINTRIIALEALNKSSITVHIAIIESIITDIKGVNNDSIFKSVVKTLLPNASGTNFNQLWDEGNSEIINSSWTLTNVYDTAQLSVVVYIQDEKTKEIYQAISSGNRNTMMVNIDENEEIKSNHLVLYPNPASDNVILIIKDNEEDNLIITISNELGQQVETIKSFDSNMVQIPVSSYKPGIYYVQLKNNNRIIDTRKLIIIK